ncbi:MAG: ferrous iron transport protein A [Thermodesulfobacteriota bacterium]|nr:ferrous iron transport protein A [Thermodesulfobacteriota bacterium]
MNDVVQLSELEIGEKGKVIKVNGKGEINRRIRDMGIVPGTLLEVETKATLGDPIEIKVKGYHLTLRRKEASDIDIEKIH